MSYKFTIEDFEGPLDLLLHLIQKKEKNIIDINVNEVAQQYVVFIKDQQQANLEIASEYLVMASYLVELKSKAVLPIEKSEVEGEYEESEKQKLIEKLIEYKKFKNTISFFELSYKDRLKQHTKQPTNLKHLEVPKEDRGFGDKWNKDKLSNAIAKMLQRLSAQTPLTTSITTAPINLQELEMSILNLTKESSNLNIIELFKKRRDKPYIIATIICILDLTKNKLIKITQKEEFGDIFISRKD